MIKFEKVSKYKDVDLIMPARATKCAAGYDFAAAEDVVIPSYKKCIDVLKDFDKSIHFKDFLDILVSHPEDLISIEYPKPLEEMAALTKLSKAKPTLVPTGIKCCLDDDKYLELVVRSSSPLKYWLVLANGVGVIDADYYNNEDNEGEIFFQLINLSPFDIIVKKGEKIGQGIIKQYYLADDDCATDLRTGGFGSTTK